MNPCTVISAQTESQNNFQQAVDSRRRGNDGTVFFQLIDGVSSIALRSGFSSKNAQVQGENPRKVVRLVRIFNAAGADLG
ncbi:hypothetical protein [Conchiformibius kuhniae]|uniref:Uncharacterized protein n=1 Tax=Conchiformibius kuhniae TaxID=211502 RepID=A0ABD8B7T3_9NEIS|nr:hypothetical protein [Conchiformibius kuhniae]